MARPVKEGLEYFPMDIDFYDDPKILLVEEQFGLKGGYISIRLLCWIYREGYYLTWDDTTALIFAKRVGNGISKQLVNDVVKLLVERGFFDKTIFYSRSVLTSNGIQKRWIDIITNCKRKASVKKEYLVNSIIEVVNTEETMAIMEETPAKPELTTAIPEETTQSKVKKSKVKKEVKVFISPSLLEFKEYFKENGFRLDVAERAWKGYDVANWHDSQGNPVKNWKQKCQNVWFKDENKTSKTQAAIGVHPGNYTEMFQPKVNKY